MRFKQFLAREDANSSEKGLMISDKEPPTAIPSGGRPFSQYLSSFGPKKSAGGGAVPMGGDAMMMKKKMRKKMKST